MKTIPTEQYQIHPKDILKLVPTEKNQNENKNWPKNYWDAYHICRKWCKGSRTKMAKPMNVQYLIDSLRTVVGSSIRNRMATGAFSHNEFSE